MSLIDNGTSIGPKNVTGTIYSVLVEYKNEEDDGLSVDIVCDTPRKETADLVLDTLNVMLKNGMLDSNRIVEFYLDEEDMDDNTMIADNLLESLLAGDKRFEDGKSNPIWQLLKIVYDFEKALEAKK